MIVGHVQAVAKPPVNVAEDDDDDDDSDDDDDEDSDEDDEVRV